MMMRDDKADKKESQALHAHALDDAQIRVFSRRELPWLLDLVYTDLTKLSPGRWTDLIDEIAAFSFYGRIKSYPKIVDFWRRTQEPERPTPQMASRLQVIARQYLENFAEGKTVQFQPKQTTFVLKKTLRRNGQTHVTELIKSKQLEEAFRFQIREALLEDGFKVTRCVECQKVYVQDRETQKYCSRRCQSRVMQRRFLDKKRRDTQ
jgi:hypothetical protein